MEYFNPDGFEYLYNSESQSFWFNARNKLIVWFLDKYFNRKRQNGEKIKYLEIGCGTGFVLQAVKNKFPDWDITGTELFEEGLAFAKKRVPDVRFMQLNALEINIDETFSVVGAFDVLEHIPEDEKVMCNLYKILDRLQGGIFTVPQHKFMWSSADEAACHCRRYTRKEMVDKLHKAGFEIVRTTSFVSLLFPAMWIMRRRKQDKTPQPSSTDKHQVEELRLPKVLNWILEAVMAVERLLIKCGINFPFGGSLLVIFRKKADKGE
ncbi:MAG: class I SAM-dependent methyltransferase [Bacteroidales bacterium]|nr:class I SAM-dependent methyltransferase [Bacteroidales bacterium]